jgi:hypothetical protein
VREVDDSAASSSGGRLFREEVVADSTVGVGLRRYLRVVC